MAAFTPYAGSGTGSLMSALLAPGSGITIGPDLIASVAVGYFVDKADGYFPIEYQGASALLKFVAPIQPGVNTISIGIVDTGDHIDHSRFFIVNLTAGAIPDSDVVLPAGAACSNGTDTVCGSDGCPDHRCD